jgi:DeoR family fructose operon transcriptional repressor
MKKIILTKFLMFILKGDIKMLAEERRQRILEELNNNGSIQVTDLSRLFDVTEETIRQDLKKLEKKNLLKKIHGGAISIKQKESKVELSFDIRKEKNIISKRKIAKKAAEFVDVGDTIFMDASSTALFLANKLIDSRNITVITSSNRIVSELAKNKNITVISTGGLLRPNSLSFVGPVANNTLKKYHANKAFISCQGISLEHGITNSNELEIEIKQNMIARASKVFLLADRTKFNKIGLTQFASTEEIDKIITDDSIEESILNSFHKVGKKIIID